jgi:hypothetical protein
VTTVLINGKKYGTGTQLFFFFFFFFVSVCFYFMRRRLVLTGAWSNKKVSKQIAAEATLEILCPGPSAISLRVRFVSATAIAALSKPQLLLQRRFDFLKCHLHCATKASFSDAPQEFFRKRTCAMTWRTPSIRLSKWFTISPLLSSPLLLLCLHLYHLPVPS